MESMGKGNGIMQATMTKDGLRQLYRRIAASDPIPIDTLDFALGGGQGCRTMHKSALALLLLAVFLPGCSRSPSPSVSVFCAQDQTYSEPFGERFTKVSGIRAQFVFDTEAAKTIGLVNRIVAEAKNPQCDVFWNNEIVQSIFLKKQGLLQPYVSPAAADVPGAFKDKDGYWTGFGGRARVLLVNTNLVPAGQEPRSIFELADPKWRGQVAMAYPLFGTTATHSAALFAALGEEKAAKLYRDLKANELVIVDGNATAKDRVADGHLKVCITDSDDANLALRAGKPVKVVYPDQDANGIGTLLMPNTVCLVRNSPHPEAGKKLIDFLLSREVEAQLAKDGAVQLTLHSGADKPPQVLDYGQVKAMMVDWEQVADRLKPTAEFMQKLFVR